MADTQNNLILKVGLTFSQTEAMQNFNQQFAIFQSKLKDVDVAKTMGFTKVKTDADNAGKSISKLGGFVDGLGKKFMAQAKNLLVFSALSGGILFLTTRIRDAIAVVSELDKSYTNFAIVTGATADEIARMDAEASKLTETLGKLKKEVIDSITEFSRAGYGTTDAITLAEQSIIGANVGFTDLANVTKFVIAGLKSFKLEAEDSARLIDVLFQVANKTAIDFQGIGDAFLRSANTLQVAGASLEESTALISAANESIQDPAKVGTALKTIAARLRGVGDEGEVIPTLARDFKAVGIEIQNADGSFRNIYEIFRDFAKVYGTLDDLTKQSLVEKIAGKRQANIFIGLIENFDIAEMSLVEGLNSIGAAAEANERFLESIEGRINLLREATNDLYQTLLSSDAIKFFISLLTEVVKILNVIAKVLPEITLAFGTFLSFQALASAITAISSLTFATAGLLPLLGVLAPILGGVTVAIAGLSLVMSKYSDDAQTAATETEKLAKKQNELKREVESATISEKKLAAERIKSILEERRQLKELQSEREKQLNSGTIAELAKSSGDAVANYTTKINELEERLRGMGFTVDEATTFMKETILTVEKLSDSSLELADKLGLVNSFLIDSSDNHQLLADAIEQATTEGFLSDELLAQLIEKYPEFVSATGLVRDEIVKFANEQIEANKKTVESNLIALKQDLETAKERLAIYQLEKTRLIELANARQIGGYGIGYAAQGQGNLAEEETVNIKNIETAIARLNNELGQFDKVEKNLASNIAKTNKSTSNSVSILTAEEKIVRDLNQQIAIKQKLLSRTDDEKEQIKINKELIDLNKQLKTALITQKDAYMLANKSLKDGTPEYDKYIENLYKMSLQIEDVTNSIYSLETANYNLTKSMIELSKKTSEEGMASALEGINKLIDEQISEIEKLKKKSEEYYDSLIDNKQAEIDSFKESNELVDEAVRLQEALQSLEDARERKRNILANRNVRLVKNSEVGFEFVADPRELKKVNEEIIAEEKNVASVREDIFRNETIRRLELEKSALEESKRLNQENYDKQILLLEAYRIEVESITDAGDKLSKANLTTLMSDLAKIEGASYSERLGALASFIADYNNYLLSLNSANSKLESPTLSAPTVSSKGFLDLDSIYSNTSTGANTVAPSATNLSKSITTTSTKTNSTNIGQINVTSPAKSIDQLLQDVNSKAKVYSPRVELY